MLSKLTVYVIGSVSSFEGRSEFGVGQPEIRINSTGIKKSVNNLFTIVIQYRRFGKKSKYLRRGDGQRRVQRRGAEGMCKNEPKCSERPPGLVQKLLRAVIFHIDNRQGSELLPKGPEKFVPVEVLSQGIVGVRSDRGYLHRVEDPDLHVP